MRAGRHGVCAAGGRECCLADGASTCRRRRMPGCGLAIGLATARPVWLSATRNCPRSSGHRRSAGSGWQQRCKHRLQRKQSHRAALSNHPAPSAGWENWAQALPTWPRGRKLRLPRRRQAAASGATAGRASPGVRPGQGRRRRMHAPGGRESAPRRVIALHRRAQRRHRRLRLSGVLSCCELEISRYCLHFTRCLSHRRCWALACCCWRCESGSKLVK